MRTQIAEALKTAQKEKNKRRIGTLRLINAAIIDRDIALRSKGKDRAADEEIMEILVKMIKQREESANIYKNGGRPELEKQEKEEIGIIREFLPRPLSEEEASKAIQTAIRETEAGSLRDMGKVMAWLKERYRGQMDMAKAGAQIKAALGG